MVVRVWEGGGGGAGALKSLMERLDLIHGEHGWRLKQCSYNPRKSFGKYL